MVEFLLTALLVVTVALGLIQLALTIHVKNTLMACAAEGARVAAREAWEPVDGAQRARECARDSVAVEATATTARVDVGGQQGVSVTITGDAPVLGVWQVGRVSATARALDEAAIGGP